MVTGTQCPKPEELTAVAVSVVLSSSPLPFVPLPPTATNHPSTMSAKSTAIYEKFAARIDDSASPSVDLAAARLLDVEPEKERWIGGVIRD